MAAVEHPVLETHGLTVRFGGHIAVNDVSCGPSEMPRSRLEPGARAAQTSARLAMLRDPGTRIRPSRAPRVRIGRRSGAPDLAPDPLIGPPG